MKIWLICLALSMLISVCGLIGFIYVSAQDICLDSGGRWLGLISGCDEGKTYSLQYLSSPLAIMVFLGITVGISSVLVQI
ncbi:hypothetical protein Q4595_26165, partial [Wenyingzhuangia sp. 1_MG-2023]|nr:hypothetical protein [Wenyingzhuangia sp. 1_MG-2023]